MRVLTCLLLLAACSSSTESPDAGTTATPDAGTVATPSPGSGTFNGTVDGHGITVKAAVFGTGDGVNGDPNFVTLMLADVDTVCADRPAGRIRKGSATFVASLQHMNQGNGIPPVTGTYEVRLATTQETDARVSSAGVLVFDDACHKAIPDADSLATSGTITVTKLDVAGGVLQGSFDLVVGPQADHVTGTFDAAKCADLLKPPAGGTTCE